MPQYHHRAHAQDQLCRKLCIGDSVKREQPVQYEQRRDLQCNFTHNGKYEGISSQSQRLEYAYRKEINSQECQSQTESS